MEVKRKASKRVANPSRGKTHAGSSPATSANLDYYERSQYNLGYSDGYRRGTVDGFAQASATLIDKLSKLVDWEKKVRESFNARVEDPIREADKRHNRMG